MTTDGWDQVLDIYQAEIYELCNRAVAHARLHDEIDRIVANWADEKITIENAVELIKEAAKKCEADIDSGRALGQGLRIRPGYKMDDKTDEQLQNEPGFLQDWSFIHLRAENIIYDISTGIEYAYAEHGEMAALYIWHVGSTRSRAVAVYEDAIAREFWRQLLARIAL